ncbi:hypothetical protein KIN20_038391 [Parelaphostrongylus tenuis]|uniref:Uncharacterized protein n=1 Tax=Parelaphostrongylus tenuis TaxID=148309 RepID=A0AAD5MLY2_PARTN|nr:hypothetical protein KIN20_038391 [Parelaphostrongylus tenuis]
MGGTNGNTKTCQMASVLLLKTAGTKSSALCLSIDIFFYRFSLWSALVVSKVPLSPVVPLIVEGFERVPATLSFFLIACKSSSMDPRRSRDSLSIIFFFHTFCEEIGLMYCKIILGKPDFMSRDHK